MYVTPRLKEMDIKESQEQLRAELRKTREATYSTMHAQIYCTVGFRHMFMNTKCTKHDLSLLLPAALFLSVTLPYGLAGYCSAPPYLCSVHFKERERNLQKEIEGLKIDCNRMEERERYLEKEIEKLKMECNQMEYDSAFLQKLILYLKELLKMGSIAKRKKRPIECKRSGVNRFAR
ncbi:hypothetical protein MAR_004099 [Mya arenaria]|uniref:Uncharacterized protein n=1 Tax=Mya arenaria TaxID=6604 RepID=A0ABY7EY28_MYAAR|nr:hypothetical protein MAR_004099 [Mya arenaria]